MQINTAILYCFNNFKQSSFLPKVSAYELRYQTLHVALPSAQALGAYLNAVVPAVYTGIELITEPYRLRTWLLGRGVKTWCIDRSVLLSIQSDICYSVISVCSTQIHAQQPTPACNSLAASNSLHLRMNTITALLNRLKIDESTSFSRHPLNIVFTLYWREDQVNIRLPKPFTLSCW